MTSRSYIVVVVVVVVVVASVALRFAKERCYKLGFNFGVMTCGKYAGEKVTVAKTKVRADMIAEGLAADYYEPDKLVVSRSGDECVVSFEDQWCV